MVTSPESTTQCRLRASPIFEADEQGTEPGCLLWYYLSIFRRGGSMSMLAASVRRKRLFATATVAAALYTVAVLGLALSAENEQIPNFSPDNVTGWLKPPGDEFLPPASGPGPVKSDPAHRYVSNAVARQETVKIADLTNPILQPWVVEKMRKANEEVLAGKVG